MFSFLLVLTKWHYPQSPAAAAVRRAAINRYLCPPGPPHQTCSSGFAAVVLCWNSQTGRQTDGHRNVIQKLPAYFAGNAKFF